MKHAAAALTPRERVERVLTGDRVRPVPFTMYESKIPQCAAEREMRNRGMCIVERRVPVFRSIRPNVKITQRIFHEEDRKFVRTFYETPHGTLTTLDEPVGFTSWHHERMFKSPEDYRALYFFITDQQFEADYTAFVRAQHDGGGDLGMVGTVPRYRLQDVVLVSRGGWRCSDLSI